MLARTPTLATKIVKKVNFRPKSTHSKPSPDSQNPAVDLLFALRMRQVHDSIAAQNSPAPIPSVTQLCWYSNRSKSTMVLPKIKEYIAALLSPRHLELSAQFVNPIDLAQFLGVFCAPWNLSKYTSRTWKKKKKKKKMEMRISNNQTARSCLVISAISRPWRFWMLRLSRLVCSTPIHRDAYSPLFDNHLWHGLQRRSRFYPSQPHCRYPRTHFGRSRLLFVSL
ncbi:hypothetical protein C8J56DRAFT_506024 [Mycena floridula]|nr:hypothetical protein C8J56DRAFT_506024 [Mycena floridula]